MLIAGQCFISYPIHGRKRVLLLCFYEYLNWSCLWKYDILLHLILNLSWNLGCSFSWSSHSTNDAANWLAKYGAKQNVCFVRNCLPVWVSLFLYFCAYYCFILGLYSYLIATVRHFSFLFTHPFHFWNHFSSLYLKRSYQWIVCF